MAAIGIKQNITMKRNLLVAPLKKLSPRTLLRKLELEMGKNL